MPMQMEGTKGVEIQALDYEKKKEIEIRMEIKDEKKEKKKTEENSRVQRWTEIIKEE